MGKWLDRLLPCCFGRGAVDVDKKSPRGRGNGQESVAVLKSVLVVKEEQERKEEGQFLTKSFTGTTLKFPGGYSNGPPLSALRRNWPTTVQQKWDREGYKNPQVQSDGDAYFNIH